MEWNSHNLKIWISQSSLRALLKGNEQQVKLILPAPGNGDGDNQEREVALFSPTLRDLHAIVRSLAVLESQKDPQGVSLETLRRFLNESLEEDSYESLAQKYQIPD